jgi:hypothetical protein
MNSENPAGSEKGSAGFQLSSLSPHQGTSTCEFLIFVRKEGKNDNNLLIIKDVCFILIFFEYLCSQICEKVKD